MRFVLVMVAAIAALANPAARAQTYPDKPVHLIVPFTPGSATDVVARALAQAMQGKLGQPVVVENKPGAGGTIGSAQVAKSAPDGYTFLVNSSAHTVNPAIYANLPYDTAKDLVGVSLLADLPNVLVVSPDKGWKTVGDLVAAAKAQPGKINYASAGTGSGTHMNAEKFRLATGIQGQHVPYRGTPEAIGDTMNGRVDFYFAPVIASLSLIREGRLVPLAIGGPKRSSVLPDVPTTEEAGYKGSAYDFWVAMFAPAGTPPALIERVNKEVVAALGVPEVKERLAALGADAAPTSAADLDKMVARELKDNADLARQAGIKVQ